MFGVDLSDFPQNIWLTGLLILWAVLLFGGFLFGRFNETKTRRMPVWTRMISSLTLVVAGWSWFLFTRESMANSFVLLIAIGMTLGLVGDLFMAQLIPVKEHVIGGIASFGLGHIAYIVAFIVFGNANGLDLATARWGSLLIWVAIGVTSWYWVVFRGRKATILHWAALPYTVLLASTAGFATGLALQNSVFTLLAVGATLFLISDLIIAVQLFNQVQFYLIDDVVWLTYGPAQMLIVYSIGSALGLVSG